MKTPSSFTRVLTVCLFAALIAAAQAADRYKANNATALNVAGSWTNNAVPGSSDLAIFNSILDGTISSYALGGNVTNNGISFRDAQSTQTITSTASSTNFLVNGSPGIDMTAAATNDFNIYCLLNLGTSGGQTFNVFNSDRTLTISNTISGTGPLVKTGGGTLKLATVHTYTGGTIISAGTLKLGSANTLPGANVTVQNGATLDLNGYSLTNKANYVIHISGTGVGGAGALVDNAGGQLNFALTNLVLDADAYVGGSSRFDMRPVTTALLPPSLDLAGHTLTKLGANTFFWQQLSSVTDGNIVVQAGTLGLNGISLTGNGKSILVKNGGTLLLFRNAAANTVSTVSCPMTLEAGSIVSYTGTDTTDPIDQSVASPITLNGDTTMSQGTAGSVFEFAGAISGGFGLNKTGAGTLLLSGPSTYAGDTLVTAGKLVLSSAWNGAGALTIGNVATLEVAPAAANATLKLNSLTLGVSGNTTNNFNLGGFANPANSLVNVTNALTLNGTTYVNLSGTTGLSSGTFKLITFGSITGTGGFQLGLTPGFNGSLATNGNSIELTIVKAALYWRGEVGGVATSDWGTGVGANWLDSLSNTRVSYADGNVVVFDDSLTGTANVTIPGTVLPGGLTITNVSTNYTFSGAGKISGTTGLTKSGPGRLNLAVANDYSGATTIANGTLQLGVANALPTSASASAVTLNGTLDLNGFNQSLAGLTGNGTLDNSSVTAATLTISNASLSTFSGLIANSGGNAGTRLFKTGGGTQTLSGNNSFSGGLSMNNGTLQLGSDTALGSGLFSIAFAGNVSSDSTTARLITNSMSFAGNSLMTLGDALNNGVLNISGPVDLLGGTRTVKFDSDVVFNGTLGNGNLTKSGSGTMTMNGVNTCAGTFFNAGTLAGIGSFSGSVAMNGGTLSPGTGIGTMTINSNLFLNKVTTTHMEVNAAANTSDLVQGMASVDYNGSTLEVTNLAGAFVAGQSFQLFAAASFTNDFGTLNLPVLNGSLSWNWNPTNGTLSVVSGVSTTPTNMSFSVSGGNLNLSWPADHLGWIAQSNSIALANTNFWFDIAGSQTATNLSIPISSSLTNVFYRIRKP